jgi:hypothetical protein
MFPNYRGLLAIIPPAVLQGSHLTSQSVVLRFSRAAILAGPLPVSCLYDVRSVPVRVQPAASNEITCENERTSEKLPPGGGALL